MAKIPLREYTRLIESLIDRGLVDEAAEHCLHILKVFPKHFQTYQQLAKCYLDKQQYSEASDILQRILSVFPDDFMGHIGMSIVQENDANLDAAIFHMERAYEVQPANVAVQDELRRLYGLRDGIEPAKIRLSRGALVRMYMRSGLFRQAIAEIRAALAEDPRRIDLEVIEAKIHNIQGEKAEAVEAARSIVTRLPYCFEANQILAEVLPTTTQAEEAELHRNRLLALDPYTAFISISSQPNPETELSVMIEPLEFKKPQEQQEPLKGQTIDSQEQVEWEENQQEEPNQVTSAQPEISPEEDVSSFEEKNEEKTPPVKGWPIENSDISNLAQETSLEPSGEDIATEFESIDAQPPILEEETPNLPLNEGQIQPPAWDELPPANVDSESPQDETASDEASVEIPPDDQPLPDWLEEMVISPTVSEDTNLNQPLIQDKVNEFQQVESIEEVENVIAPPLPAEPDLEADEFVGGIEDQQAEILSDGTQHHPGVEEVVEEAATRQQSEPPAVLEPVSEISAMETLEPQPQPAPLANPEVVSIAENADSTLPEGQAIDQQPSQPFIDEIQPDNIVADADSKLPTELSVETLSEDHIDFPEKAQGEVIGEQGLDAHKVPDISSDSILSDNEVLNPEPSIVESRPEEAQASREMDFETAFAWLESLAARQNQSTDMDVQISAESKTAEDWSGSFQEPSIEEAEAPTQPVRINPPVSLPEKPTDIIDQQEMFESIDEKKNGPGDDTTQTQDVVSVREKASEQQVDEQTSSNTSEDNNLMEHPDLSEEPNPPAVSLTANPDWLKGDDVNTSTQVGSEQEDTPLPDWLLGLEGSTLQNQVDGEAQQTTSGTLIQENKPETGVVDEVIHAEDGTPHWLDKLVEGFVGSEKVELPDEGDTRSTPIDLQSQWVDMPVKDSQSLLTQAQTALSNQDLIQALNSYNDLILHGKFIEETIHDLRSFLGAHPEDLRTWQSLGDAYAKNNELQNALDAYTQAEDLLT